MYNVNVYLYEDLNRIYPYYIYLKKNVKVMLAMHVH